MEEPVDSLENKLYGVGWDRSLPAVLYQDGEEHEEKKAEIKKGYKITVPTMADWAIKRLKEADKERDEHVERITAQRKLVSDFESKIRGKHKRESDFFVELLRDWATDEIKKTKGKEKNIKCIEGTLSFRTATPEMLYDIEELIKYAKRNGFPQIIVTKESVSAAELRKAMVDGADLPVTWVGKEDHFNVSFAEETT